MDTSIREVIERGVDLNKVNRINVESAIARLSSGEVVEGYRPSTDYDLIHNGNAYPPKQVMALAYKEATGEIISPEEFRGGAGTPLFNRLLELGFAVRPKGVSPELIFPPALFTLITEIRRRKQRWSELSAEQQVLMSQARDTLELFAQDFVARNWTKLPMNFNLSRLQNQEGSANSKLYVVFSARKFEYFDAAIQFLIQVDHDGVHFGLSMGRMDIPQNVRTIARNQMAALQTQMLSMPEDMIATLEEAISAGQHLYLDETEDTEASSVGDWFWQAGKKPLAHITQSLTAAAVAQSKNLSTGTIDKCFETFLPTLRFLSPMTNEEAVTNRAWIFQGNPGIFKMNEYLESRKECSWTVKQYAAEIKTGDRVYIWRAGENSGIVALAEAISDVSIQPDDFSEYWIEAPKDNEKKERVRLRLLEVRVRNPLLRSEIRKKLPDLRIINAPQGTNFPVTTEQDVIIRQLLGGVVPVSLPPDPVPVVEEPRNYTRADLLKGLFIEESKVDAMLRTLKAKRNLILQGPPGVGKTFVARSLAYCHMGEKDDTRVGFVQFHQSYSYEDFVQGIRPDGAGGFRVQDGVFKLFCQRAAKDTEREYVFIIDEINRGNLSKILGELMMLMEHDKRGPKHQVNLTYSPEEKFHVPENVRIIGMLNTADRSLALVDYALRRRFNFIEVSPGFNSSKFTEHLQARNIHPDRSKMIVQALDNLNKSISEAKELGAGFLIGHSYFCGATKIADQKAWLHDIFELEIGPLLREYWFDNQKKSEEVLTKLSKDLFEG